LDSDGPSAPAVAPKDDFLAALRRVPEPVAVVASDGPQGPGAVTVTAFSTVSADPPTILVCLQSRGSAAACIIANGRFSVNFLGEEDLALAKVCAGHGAADHARRLATTGWHADADGLPHWGRALASLSCRLEQTVEIASHRVLVARVTAAAPGPTRRPLIYQARRYHALGKTIVD